MVGWHHRHEFEQTLGDGEGQESLVCCSPWGLRVGQDLATEQQHHRTSRTHLSRKFSALQSRSNNCLGLKKKKKKNTQKLLF